jgi:hypothetical protein
MEQPNVLCDQKIRCSLFQAEEQSNVAAVILRVDSAILTRKLGIWGMGDTS